MILVDTSIWIDHLRTGEPGLADLLDEGQVLGHAGVTGELALANSPSAEKSSRCLPISGRQRRHLIPKS